MNVKKNISVILNGQMPTDDTIINQITNSDFIIAVDGSANKLFDLKIIPDVIIGDLDSLQNIENKDIELIEAPDQNKTDFRKTLEWCIEKNILNISIFGISGESEDHFLGNYYTLSDFGEKISWKAFTDFSMISPCVGNKKFESFKGQKVSLFCMRGSSTVNSENLEYPLQSYHLKPSDDAIRNLSLEDHFTIESTTTILVFQSRV
jgi:thiamine pyrophosphokinase|tara:strand:- start:501 stop:1118 length:618 start_codon:yes stop_codon:yes gene_type:complete